MSEKIPIVMSWSGGKDSALALHKLLQSGDYNIKYLLTTFNKEDGSAGLHGIPSSLIKKQVQSIDIPLIEVYSDGPGYEEAVLNAFQQLKKEGIKGIAFGDIFLEDLKNYRDELLKNVDLQGIYPIWRMKSEEVLNQFLSNNFKSKVCAANKKFFKEYEIGEDLSFDLLKNKNIDLCGENGEYHSFVYEGPIFSKALSIYLKNVRSKKYSFTIQKNDKKEIQKEEFLYADLIAE